MNSRKYQGDAYCPRCFWKGQLQKHHVLPSKHFKPEENRGHKIYLCPNCHSKIHNVIDKLAKLTLAEYISIHKAFIKGKSYDILRCVRR